jgi:hypothetical protein
MVLCQLASCGVEDYGWRRGGVRDGVVMVLCNGREGGRVENCVLMVLCQWVGCGVNSNGGGG